MPKVRNDVLNMDRIVLRVPHRSRGIGGNLISVVLAAVACLLAFSFVDTTSLSLLLASLLKQWNADVYCREAAIVLCIVGVYCTYRMAFCRRQLTEAAIEITPLGVQLVSLYDKSIGRETNVKDTICKVRAFIPHQQILDVVVIEVVWSHCVWSQLVFRVVKNTKEVSNQDIQDMQKQSKETIRKLMQQNQISIIPAFPDECRGMLSYEQCLNIQSELEEYLDLHCRCE